MLQTGSHLSFRKPGRVGSIKLRPCRSLNQTLLMCCNKKIGNFQTTVIFDFTINIILLSAEYARWPYPLASSLSFTILFCSEVNKDLSHKAKAKDLGHKAKAKAKDSGHKAKAKAKDLNIGP